jgi:hypothetical protein
MLLKRGNLTLKSEIGYEGYFKCSEKCIKHDLNKIQFEWKLSNNILKNEMLYCTAANS